MSVLVEGRSGLDRTQPRPQRVATTLRALQLGVDGEAKLGEERVDVHGIGSDHDAAHPVLPARMQGTRLAAFQDVDEFAQWQADRRHAPSQEGTLHLRLGHDLGQEGHEVSQKLGALLLTPLHQDRGDTDGIER